MTRRFASLDIEATGTSPDGDRAVEVAVVRLEADGTRTARRWLLNPERPIPADAHEFVRRVCRNDRPRAPGAPPLRAAPPPSDDPDDNEFDIPF